MPTLNWIGKEKVVNHHMDVPFRPLKKQYTFNAESSDNMIIHGDNLEALKALLPKYEGKVDVIYIDPPYNTGNESWVYNDNVNDPRIRRWLGQVVGAEGEDLSRHDKWLCMMYPRLVLLQKLLSDTGAIFISIDDNEQANLKQVCDEIFGKSNFVSNISWQRTYSPRNDAKGICQEVEYVLCYSKKPNWQPNKLPRTAEMDSKYKNPDNDHTPWTSSDCFGPGASSHQGMVYAIQSPFSGEYVYPYIGAHWTLKQSDILSIMQGWANYELRDINDKDERAKVCGVKPGEVKDGVFAIVLKDSLEIARKHAIDVLENGPWPKFYFTNGGKGGMRRKTYLDANSGKVVTNLWPHIEVGNTDEAKKEVKALFEGEAVFDTPKPTRLIRRILDIASNKDSIILDSFAGCGTTAHAVLNLNKEDGGKRKFILCEMCDYAESITAERVRRVINGYGKDNKAVPGTGGDFSFYELGEPIIKDGSINPDVTEEELRKFIYYSETRTDLPEANPDDPTLMGVHNGVAFYLNYSDNCCTVLDRDYLRALKTKADSYVIYAGRCTLSEAELEKFGITFKKTSRDVRAF